jgi:DNA-binding MarR family transcriptional regulator
MMHQHSYNDLVTFRLKRAYMAANQRADALLQPHGLGRTQWHILHLLAQNKLMGQRELQIVLQVESPTLALIVSNMVEKGWIDQLPSKTDKRKKDLRLTAAGKRLQKAVPSPVIAVEKTATLGLSQAEIKQVLEALAKIAKNLEQ